jgi:putative transposase
VTFVRRLDQVVARFRWFCHAYCLMGNHYHLLVETPKPNLARGMRQLSGVYAQQFNRRHSRRGHLFQARYHAVLVEKERHLLELARYLVLNPVRAKLCDRPGAWRWSSYRATAAFELPPRFLTIDWLLSQFGENRQVAQRLYRDFVDARHIRNPWESLIGEIYLGSPEFAAAARVRSARLTETPRQQWQPVRPPLAELLASGRPDDILIAYREHGYALADIAAAQGVHYSTVSRALARLEAVTDPLIDLARPEEIVPSMSTSRWLAA